MNVSALNNAMPMEYETTVYIELRGGYGRVKQALLHRRGIGRFILRRNLFSPSEGGWARKKSSPAAQGQEAGVSRSVQLAAADIV